MKRRVVVTGMGAITPIGNSVSEFWNNVKKNKNGIEQITYFNTEDFKVKLAAEVKNFNVEDYIGKKDAKRMDKYTQFAVISSNEAIKDSKLELGNIDKERVGVVFGSGIGGIGTIENQINTLKDRGPSRVSPLTIPMGIANIAAGTIAIEHGILGSCLSLNSACATSTHAIGEAYRSIKDGYLDVIIAGGSEASITPFGIAGFQSLTALSRSEDKDRASIPFDKDRNGFVMGEGAGALILEDLDSALKRGAKIYAEVVGYGTTCDAYHITSPSSDGDGAARAMIQAMKDADISSRHIGYINAHGTSTELNDKTETRAIKNALGDYAYKVAISSTKSMTGHLLGAAGSVEGIFAVKAIEDSFIPPTVGYKVPDEECDLDYTPNVGRNADVQVALSSSLGFGGHNAVIAFRKWNGR